MTDEERFRVGDGRRREVLGDCHVDSSTAGLTGLDREFFDFLTRYAWGEIWTRPGLDTATRRLLVLAMMAALGREREFKLHLRAALEDGVEEATIREVLMQAAVYCGVPAAHSAFHWTKETLAGVQ